MHFCEVCSNMYYIKIADDDDSSLINYCRKCGNEQKIVDEESICVSKINLNNNVKNTSLLLVINILNRSNTTKIK